MAPSWLTRHRAVRTGLASSRVRFEQRAADVRRRPARLIAALMSVVVVAAVVAWLVFFSSVLALREVRVEGVEEADKAAVLAAVTVPPGTPLARVDLAAVTAAVAKVAVVREAHLTRSWPDALTVTVYPRVPLVALRNSDGSYTYSGRSDDMLKVSGIYVSPFEVEATLVQHPAVLEAAVIGVTDADGLTKTKAFVVLKSGEEADAATLQAFVKDRLAAYKYPRSIEFLSELPKTATGKIQRFRLREREAAAR
jgi:acyl-CoA synthetase (AMP-forming)/AMP-acid ligase II